LRVFVAAVTFLPSLPSNDRRDTHTDIETDGRGFMKYAVEMGSDAMIFIPNFVKIGSGIQKMIGEDTYADTQTEK
jgi:hypothetical protein